MPQYLLGVWHDDDYADLDFSSPDMQRVFAQVSALHCVEDVAASAIRLGAARRVAERKEDPAAVAFEPVDLERERLAGELEMRPREGPKEHWFRAARRNRLRRRIDVF